MGVGSVFGQGIKIGMKTGLPVGKESELTTFQLSGEVGYLFPATDLLSVGGLIGYSRYFLDNVTVITSEWKQIEDYFSFVPIAATMRFAFQNSLFFEGDIGYAIGIDYGNDGGFYYSPKVGHTLGQFNIIASFSGLRVVGRDLSFVNLGVEFGF